MIIWLDAQLPDSLAKWITQRFSVEATAVRELGLRNASDTEIFLAARAVDAVLISKDIDFVELVQRLGAPPRLIWLTCGNVSNARLETVFELSFERAIGVLESGSEIVEVTDVD